jgi:hypothetical protein
MRKIIYIFILAVVFLIAKAFYLDDYIAEYKSADTNISSENNSSSEENSSISPVETIEQHYNSQKKMPLDQLGDSIAEKIEDKL